MAKRKKRILIVEDEPFLVEMYKARFEQENYKVDVAFDGTGVIDAIQKNKPDIVLLDIVMPEKDGFAVLRELKTRKDLHMTPILVFSNLAQDEEIKKGLDLGADKYFIKSEYTPSQLVSEVEKMIGSAK